MGQLCYLCSGVPGWFNCWSNLPSIEEVSDGLLKINNTFCHISVERSLGRIFSLGTFGHRVLLMQFLCKLEDTVVSNRSQSNSRVNYRRKRWLLTAGQTEGPL